MLTSKSTQSSLKALPQSTVGMERGKPEMAKNQNHSSSFFLSFFNQSSAVMRKVLHSKLPPVAREFSGGGAFALCFECNCDITPALFNRGGRVY